MKLSNIINEIEAGYLSELDIQIPANPAAPAPTAGAAPMNDPQAQAKMQAAQMKQMADRKKQIQDTIKQKQVEIQQLQKELSMLK